MDVAAVRKLTDLFYLALVVYREARGEPDEAKLAVAWSVLNRVAKPSWWGSSVESVVTKKWQYSSMTDPHDPQLARAWPVSVDPMWGRCLTIASDAMDGTSTDPLPGADSYHDTSISPPSWTTGARKCGQIGRLVFYDVDHDHGG